MSNITCRSCGKRYDYLNSDLCPHCGAYNKPTSRLRVDFNEEGSAELLNEQQFQQQSAANRQRKDCYEQPIRQGKPAALHRPTGGNAALRTIVLSIVVAVIIGVISLTFMRVETLKQTWNQPEEFAEDVSGDEAYIFYYDVGEQFVVNGQPVTVEAVALEEEILSVTLQWASPDPMPRLHIFYENGGVLEDYPYAVEDKEDGVWQCGYIGDDGENVAKAYLVFTDFGDDQVPFYEVWTDITEIFSSMS